ncbi:MAG: DUF5123 domain-containing protein [Candidatus Omnitrophica bacterium]|nr:DUF5123 domain-containing protein [Candidatus Omnitrophota bacterium]
MAKCRITASFLFSLLVAVLINPVHAATIEVHPGESIQNAINEAVSGDTVFVFSGAYPETISMKNGINVAGETHRSVILKGRVFFKDADCTLKDFTVLFPEGSLLSYNNAYYTELNLEADAGITIINSAPVIQKCVIKPDLELINSAEGSVPPIEYYGKAIQIWNMYNNPAITPKIESTLIQDTDCGIYYFSQVFGGAISGEIKNNTFYHNKTGIVLRMHKETPHILNNIFDSTQDSAVFLTYEDAGLFITRKANINNNLFNQNSGNFWLDSAATNFDLIGIQGNIQDDPLFLDPLNDDFHLQAGSPALTAGEGGSLIGAYGEAGISELFIEITSPQSGITIYPEP